MSWEVLTLLWNFAQKSDLDGRRQDYNSQEDPWPSQALHADVPFNKTSSSACSLRVRRTAVVLEGERRKKSTWQCHFYNNTAFSFWNTGLMGQNNKITLFFLLHVCGLMPAGPHWVVLGCSILGNVTSGCLGVDPQGFSGMSDAHLHGAPLPALGAVGALELGLELSTVLPHPLCPSWEDVRPFLMALL